MTRTYAVQKCARGWSLSVTDDTPGWLGSPTRLGIYATRNAALTTARLLAGRTSRVVLFKGN